ncbi:MAG: hypothetical protein A3E82_02905 [Gammaproteobacteria bacterium RIFCSPHIGHO2_12_FULL_38_11]|nr:MAG: hypothetical protein A3E82_02905 [Gammaproteobacteria bacterium RIFCSPHIGHO2_12_FULL_38_11]
MRHDRDPGRIFKSIRADEMGFWEKFAEELVNPENPQTRFEKRVECDRLPFTIRLNSKTSQYEVVETAKDPATQRKSNPLYSLTEKMSVTKQQSVSYANPKGGYTPPVFGWNKDNRKELLVGVSFTPEDCLFWTMAVYDVGTHARAKDFHTYKDAQTYLNIQIRDKLYHTSLKALEAAGGENLESYNELLAGLKWNLNGSAHITVFSNNLESRLLAQLRAADLQKRLEEKYPGQKQITVPISIYPNFDFYTLKMQQNDLNNAAKEKLLHYVAAMELTKTGSITLAEEVDYLLCYDSLKKLRKKLADDFLEKNYGNMDLYISMYELNSATSKNATEIITKITARALKLIEKCSADQLTVGFSKEIKTGEYASSTGFYWLINALSEAVFTSTAECATGIANLTLKIIEKCSADQIAAGLSKQADINTGDTGFYWLMGALSNAIRKNSAVSPTKITVLAFKIIEKCSADQMAAGLSKQVTRGDFVGSTGFYWLICSLQNAVASDLADENITEIRTLADRIIEKCTTDQIATPFFMKITTGSHAGMTCFNWLMRALYLTIDKGSTASIKKTTSFVLKLIEKCSIDQIAAEFFKKTILKVNSNITGFYCLMYALSNAAINSDENATEITTLMLKIIEKCDADQIAAELFRNVTSFNNTITTAFNYLILALNSAVGFDNLTENFTKMITLALKLIEKCSADQLAVGFSKKITADRHKSSTGFYCLTHAPRDPAFNNLAKSIAKTADVIFKIMAKLHFSKQLHFLKGLNTKEYQILNSVSVDKTFNIEKLKATVVLRICFYMHLNISNENSGNSSYFNFKTKDIKTKRADAKNLMDGIFDCESAEEIKQLIESSQTPNNEISKLNKSSIEKINYTQCLKDCISKIETYERIFPQQKSTLAWLGVF